MSMTTDPDPSAGILIPEEVKPDDGRRRPTKKKKASRREKGFSLSAFLLLLPAVIILGVFTIYPLIRMFIMSTQKFTKKNAFNPDLPVEFLGLKNYTDVLSDSYFWTVLARSFALCIVLVVLTMTLGMLVALLMHKLPKFLKVMVSVGLLLAWAMPALISTVIWKWMFDTSYGVVNYVLTSLGLDYNMHSWLSDPLSFFGVIVLIVTWQSVPFVAFTLLAGLTQVPDEVMEAAQLDGTNAWQRFWQITVPFIKPVIAVVLMLQIIWDMKMFTQVYALQTGDTDSTNTIGVYIFRYGVTGGQYGTGSAIAVIFTIIMLAIGFTYIRQLLKDEDL